MQHRLKAAVRPAWAQVVAAEALDQFFDAVDDPVATLHVSFAEGTPYGACSSVQKVTSSSRSMARPPWERGNLVAVVPGGNGVPWLANRVETA